MSKRLIFLVEGDCERFFIEKKVIPYLYGLPQVSGWSFSAQKITTNRRLQKKGGNISYAYLKNEVNRLRPSGVWITTMLDFFRIPNDFPCFSTDSIQIDNIQASMKEDIQYPRFLPYIQQYEFESLLFSDVKGFEFVLDDEKQMNKIRDIINTYPNPEDINGGSATAPSKRLESIFHYQKTSDSELILSEMNLDTIRTKCPRFNQWIESIIGTLE